MAGGREDGRDRRREEGRRMRDADNLYTVGRRRGMQIIYSYTYKIQRAFHASSCTVVHCFKAGRTLCSCAGSWQLADPRVT